MARAMEWRETGMRPSWKATAHTCRSGMPTNTPTGTVNAGSARTTAAAAGVVTVMNATPYAEIGGLAGRPPVEVPDARGVFLVGDWVGHRGMLLDAVMSSASEASRAALDLVRSTRPDASLTPPIREAVPPPTLHA